MMTIEDQPELALSRPPQQVAIPLEMIRAKKTSGAAFGLACDISGLDDKEVYLALGIDAGYFTNIKKGKATLQADLIVNFCQIVGNTVYPEWIAYQVGCSLVMLRSEAERKMDMEKALRIKYEDENRLLRSLLVGRAA
jgi:hypothetical protein